MQGLVSRKVKEVKLNPEEYAKQLKRRSGEDKALRIAVNSFKNVTVNQNEKLYPEKEFKKLQNFWRQIIGILERK